METFKLQSENDEKTILFNKLLTQNRILTKELEQCKREYGDLLLNHHETQRNLAESRTESAELRGRLDLANKEGQMLRDQSREVTYEVNFLKKQNGELIEEIRVLEVGKEKIGEELKGLKREISRLEVEKEGIRVKAKNLLEKLKEFEKGREEKLKLSFMSSRLKKDLETVLNAAEVRSRAVDQWALELEQLIANSNGNPEVADSQLDATEILVLEQESFSEVQYEEVATTQSPIKEEKTASSPPSPKKVGETCVMGLQETSDSNKRYTEPSQTLIVSKTPSAVINLSSVPFAHKSPPAFPFIDLSDDDDDYDGSMPSSKGLKRKLPSVEDSDKRVNGGSSENHRSKEQNDLVMNDVDDRFGSYRKWEYEQDLLVNLMKDAELCMMGICALYRDQQFVLDAPRNHVSRATALAKFLSNGDAKGAMKKTLADLEKYDPKGVGDCTRIAKAHFKQLFRIYKNGKNPFFGPATLFGHNTI